LEALRNDYSDAGIDPKALPARPFEFFSLWFKQAVDAGIPEPNGMVIATADHLDDLSQRTVLMKSFDQNGFFFYTNYQSRKARQLQRNANISCLFPWLALHRQVSISGTINRASREVTERYFKSRPRGSQIGAWASRQSERLEHRETLEQRVQEFEQRFAGCEVPVPDFWGGFHVKPVRIEFWQGRTSRLHDRYVYTLNQGNQEVWSIDCLYP
ncbi:MAG: pyridoxamine 5'-phosphate oxidase, partial [bacterium]